MSASDSHADRLPDFRSHSNSNLAAFWLQSGWAWPHSCCTLLCVNFGFNRFRQNPPDTHTHTFKANYRKRLLCVSPGCILAAFYQQHGCVLAAVWLASCCIPAAASNALTMLSTFAAHTLPMSASDGFRDCMDAFWSHSDCNLGAFWMQSGFAFLLHPAAFLNACTNGLCGFLQIPHLDFYMFGKTQQHTHIKTCWRKRWLC